MTKALTLHQPYASLVALGVKRIETRSWATPYRGRLLIHAGVKVPRMTAVPGWLVSSHRITYADHVDAGHHMKRYGDDQPLHPLPLGAIVASCTLADVVPMVALPCPIRDLPARYVGVGSRNLVLGEATSESIARNGESVEDQRPYGDFAPGRFAWLLEDVAPTTERCPACWGEGCVPVVANGLTIGEVACATCEGEAGCDPVPARGRQRLWDWQP